jgi:hypothetical protein
VKPPFEWDHFSDQPKVIFDKAFKRRLRMRFISDYLKMAATAAVMLPVAMLHTTLTKTRRATAKPEITSKTDKPAIPIDLLGMGTSLEKGPAQFDLIDELGVRHVLMRLPLWDMARLADYQAFGAEFRRRGKTLIVNVLQDREHIEDLGLLKRNITRVFDAFSCITTGFQIGNAINRVKWGFASVHEYLQFYAVAQGVRDAQFPGLQLLGPPVIDFEYHFTARALFNCYNIQFDRLSALLYVDRMGSPESKQYGLFDSRKKMQLLGSLAALSPKVKKRGAYITEVNWPLKETAPWAPTSEMECVSKEDYCTFMVDYLQMAAQSGCVDRVYWHQLIAPGYGLADDRDGKLVRAPAFSAYKELLARAEH